MGDKVTRVLQVVSSLNIGSGIANFIMNYYRKIDKNKIQFDFLLFDEPEKTFTQEAIEQGARVYYISKPSLTSMFTYKKQVKTFFKEHKGEWDVLHLHEVLIQGVVLPAAKRVGIKKRIVHAHGGNIKVGIVKRARNYLLEFNMLRNANCFMACSDHAALAEFGNKRKYIVINNAIDIDNYCFSSSNIMEIKKEIGINQGDFVLGTVGRISMQKNPFFFVGVMKKIATRIPNGKFLYIGDGELRNELEKEIKNSGLSPRFLFLGNRSDCNRVMQAIDCFLFPSKFEGLGIAVIEAEASGIYVIASQNVPQVTRVCDRIDYLPLDEQLWADKIIELYEKGGFNKANAHDYMEKSIYSIKKNTIVLEEIYLG